MEYNVIGKGNFGPSKASEFVSLRQYLFIEENGQKYLLLKLSNDRDESLTSLAVEVSQTDAAGLSLGSAVVRMQTVIKPDREFTFVRKIPLKSKCAAFDVKVTEAGYGNYVYSEGGGGTVLSYKKRERLKITRQSTPVKEKDAAAQTIAVRKFKLPVAVLISLLVLLSLASLFTYLRLENFKENVYSFFYGGVEYAFENDDKTEGGRVYAIGAKSTLKDAVIPEKIQSYTVTKIAERAFYGNRHITSLTAKGAIVIEDEAFLNCNSLKTVSLEGAADIGENAFRSCLNLTELNIAEAKSIGATAFSECYGLRTVKMQDHSSVLRLGERVFYNSRNILTMEINCFADYLQGTDILNSCYNISTLRLKNFNYTFTIGSETFAGVSAPLNVLFGNATHPAQLKTLTVDYMDEIPEGFCQNLPVRSVSIGSLKGTEIGDNAFASCGSLEEFNVPYIFTRIGESAFFSTAITGFDATALEFIGDSAFYGCNRLKDFNLDGNDSLTYIGNYAFGECTALESFTVPSSVTVINQGVFSTCRSLTEVVADNVTEINSFAFSDCSSLTSAPFSDKLTFIGGSAFSGCTSLEELEFPRSLTTIENNAFENCTKLTSLYIPDSVNSVGWGAFSGCIKLEEITVPFVGSAPRSANVFSYIFGGDIYSADAVPASLKKVTVLYAENIADQAFYGCASIEEIVIADGLKTIGATAFAFCGRLDNFVIPETVTRIESNAFLGCYKLVEVINNSQLVIVRAAENHGMAGYYALNVVSSKNPTRMDRFSENGFDFAKADDGKWFLINYSGTSTTLILPQDPSFNDTDINEYSVLSYFLANNKSARIITMQSAVTSIGEYAFLDCSNVTAIHASEVKTIGIGAFGGCTSLANLTVSALGGPAAGKEYLVYYFGETDYELYSAVPSSLKTVTLTNAASISAYAFYGISSLTSISFPQNITSIGEYAFKDCSFTSVTVPSSVHSIGIGAFQDCEYLQSISVPFIGETAGGGSSNRFLRYIFGATSYYEWINIPYSLKTVTVTGGTDIPAYAFYGFNNLNKINLPGGINKIGEHAFNDCNGLTSITLSQSLTEIGSYAFSGCYGFTAVELPASLTVIGDNAFFSCSNIKTLKIKSAPAIGNRAFYGCVQLGAVYNFGSLPLVAGSDNHGYAAYYAIGVLESESDAPIQEVTKGDFKYKVYKDNWVLTEYGGSAEKLTLASFEHDGKTVSSYRIGFGAFRYCYNLTEIVIGKEVKFIASNAFENCQSLKSVKLGDSGVAVIDDEVFAYCTSLTSLELPKILERIGERVFVGCRALMSVTIPEGVKEIGHDAFWNCFALCDVTDLSPHITVEKGKTENGCAGFYAFRVSTQETAALATVVSGGFTFILYGSEWFLVSVPTSSEYILLPSSFSYNSTTVSSYTLMEKAFANLSLDTINIPKSVNRIVCERYDIGYWFWLSKVVYAGSMSEWVSLTTAIPESTLLTATIYYSA